MTKRRWLTSLPLCGVVAFGVGCQDPEGGRGPDAPDLPDPIRENPQALVADKLDLLLVVDNSISMADKQAILAPSIERLITDLVNPLCVDDEGIALSETEQPAAGGEACPEGSSRVHAPVTDLHVGIISSSLGSMTTDACANASLINPDDGAHLLSRTTGGVAVPTYQNQGFLAWDPLGSLSPAGENDLQALLAHAEDMVIGVGEVGCGLEMPLEATYRFLSDPEPYQSLSTDGSFLVKNGVDDVLLAQRAAFVRPDSLVAVVLLSDENDCSIDMSGQGFLAFSGPFYRGTSACDSDPNDVCCTSCALPTPAGCAPDPVCDDPKYHDPSEDSQNLKCWDQKRRYGVDFMNPVARYTNALSLSVIDPTRPDLVPTNGTSGVVNPLFAGGRPPEFVTFTSIVGVPWQDLVSDPTNPASALKSTSQMEADGTWSWLVGPAPQDPFMRETVEARSGTNPATGQSVGSANGINGGDRPIPGHDSLQYTCIFELEQPISPGQDCEQEGASESPLCDGMTQVAAKAFPGVRQLELVRSLGDRGIAGSVCPAEVGGDPFDPGTVAARAYGYNQSVDALEANVQSYLVDE